MPDQEQNSPLDRRVGNRTLVAMHAVVSARDAVDGINCIVRDANRTGCRIVSSHVADLPDHVSLKIDGIGKPVDGEIVWRRNNQAGVEFAWMDQEKLLL